MGRAFMFGAGASHSYTESPSGVRPPLSRDFFKTYNQLAISEDRYVLVGSIVNYVLETRGVDPIAFQNWNENVEDFLTEIDDLVNTKKKALSLPMEKLFLYPRAYDEMILLFTSVLNEIQNGPPCREYRKLVDKLTPGDVLLTFNWDTLIDRALWESGIWAPEHGYGIEFKGLYEDGWKSVGGPSQTSYKLLKLHGSTNWLMPYLTLDFPSGERRFINRGVADDDQPLFCFVRAEDTYKTYQDRTKTGYAPFSYYYYPPDLPLPPSPDPPGKTLRSTVLAFDLPEHGTTTAGGYPYSSMPLIVAPVRRKRYGICGGVLDEVCALAASEIVSCTELFIIGYSFPTTDVRAWQLLAEAIRQREAGCQVVIVNPHAEELANRLRGALSGCAVTPHATTFDQFVEAL